MSNNLHWTPEQLKKLGLIEKDGKYIRASSLVAKGKVEKIQVSNGIIKSITLTNNGNPEKVCYPNSLIEVPQRYLNPQPLVNIKIKPMSVNSAWQGKRFKTPQYKKYTEAVSLLLPNDLIVPEGLLRVYYEFGMSTNSDFDNPVKLVTDILQKKYGFNDRNIMEATIKKVIVKKGEEYITFKIESL